MNKFGGTEYMLLVHELGTSAKSKSTVPSSALDYVGLKNIPLNRRFSTRARETSERSRFDFRPFAYKNMFSPLSPNALSGVKQNDKLYIVAHADPAEVGFASAKMLAGLLFAHGLRACGLITFKACEVGVGSFLDDFVNALAGRGVTLGWAKGYTGSAATTVYKQAGVITRVKESITDDHDNKIRGDARVKIVRSPTNPFVDSVGRYKVAQDTVDWMTQIQVD